MPTEAELKAQVSVLAERLEVPGVAVGVVFGDEEHLAFSGVTSVEDPLPVDEGTLFQIGSTGKTYTGTAILRLVEQGKIDLDAPVRTYVPELKLKDEQVARDVTVLQLLNHTAGWDGDLFEDTGEGADALDRYVANMANIEQVTPLGATVSYNNASLGLAGLVSRRSPADVRAGRSRAGPRAARHEPELLLREGGHDVPVRERAQTLAGRDDRDHSAVGHGSLRRADGRDVVQPRRPARVGAVPHGRRDRRGWHEGGLEKMLRRMQEPTVGCPGNALGDAVGISG